MSHDVSAVVPPPAQQIRAIMDRALQTPMPAQPVAPPNPDHVRAADAVFSQHDPESDKVAGLLGLWAGTLILHDVARDAFDPPADENEEPVRENEKPHEC
ncbi:MAG TPA: hypothetical protein VJ739_08555 [Gemmataceae bacterium]|nr:hypothetical protein [Gemmataceae bacterium]